MPAELLLEWMIDTGIGGLNIDKYLNDKEAIATVNRSFSHPSKGIMKGAIGACDGWLVYIVRPGWLRNGIRNLTTFFSRNEFFFECTVYYR